MAQWIRILYPQNPHVLLPFLHVSHDLDSLERVYTGDSIGEHDKDDFGGYSGFRQELI